MKIYLKNLFLAALLVPTVLFSFIPAASFAQGTEQVPLDYSGLVKCDGVLASSTAEPSRQKVCNFKALMETVKSLINTLFFITVPLATVLFAYAGFLYLTGSQKNIGTAKSIFSSVAKGFIIMLIAWFAVVTVVNWFLDNAFKGTVDTFIDTTN